MAMKKILIGVDGSEESRAALAFAANLARPAGASLLLAYVVEPRSADRELPGEWDVPERSYAAALLSELERECAQREVPAEGRTAIGHVAEALAEMAVTEKVDLAVVGHRGRGAVARALLGSVADRLVQISPVPVLVVR